MADPWPKQLSGRPTFNVLSEQLSSFAAMVCPGTPPPVGLCFRRNFFLRRPNFRQNQTGLPNHNPKPPQLGALWQHRAVRRKSTSGASATQCPKRLAIFTRTTRTTRAKWQQFGETVICNLIWSTCHFSTRSLEMYSFVVLSLFHFIYNESLRIILYDGVAYVWNNFGRNSAFDLRPVAVVFQT